MTYRSPLLLCRHSRCTAVNCYCTTISCGCSRSTIQDGQTALEAASVEGHHKVVEILLGAGANPDLQDKVMTIQNSGVHINLSSGMWYILHPVRPGTIVNFPARLVRVV